MSQTAASIDLADDDVLYVASRFDPVTWGELHRILNGKPYGFNVDDPQSDPQSYREFLVEPLRDQHPKKCKKKGRQIGETESCLTEILYNVDTKEYIRIMYVLPTQKLVEDFSNDRLSGAISESPYLKSKVGNIKDQKGRLIEERVNNVTLKMYGKSKLYFRPSTAKRLGEGIPVDILFVDELDSCDNVEALAAHMMSLKASRYGWERKWSTPTIPEYGIAALWALSDQRVWMNPCRKCGKYQQITYPDSLVCMNEKDNIYEYQCIYCHDTHHLGKPIMDRFQGKYVAKVTEYIPTWRSYFVCQLQAPWISATEIMRTKREDLQLESLFYNYVLGEEYLGDNVLITDRDIEQCIVDLSLEEVIGYVKKSGKILKGTDWGKTSWQLCGIPIKVEGSKKLLIFDIRVYDDDDENMHVSRMITETSREGCRLMVNDVGYGRAKNRTLANFFPGRVYNCFYPTSEFDSGSRRIKPLWNDDQQKVDVHRTTQIQFYLQQYKDINIIIPKYLMLHPHWHDFKEQHITMVKIRRINDKTGAIEEKIVHTKPDHLGHAGVYLWTAFERVATDWRSEIF